MSKKQTQVKKGAKTTKKKVVRNIPAGVVHVKATFNNTIIAITDPAGNMVSWASAGKVGYSGSRKSSAFAATVATQEAVKVAMHSGLKEVEVNLKGTGAGRESVVRALIGVGLVVSLIRDMTPVPHNGCRPRKRRRV
ncbi:30S ribosomal protein S11 [Candidatus Clavichlamydia salmonicola]|uniref:30S ribosomal protein S11 n=1 Tax=Candidatus Clavichlamydia salmonicola TaxID=469812 RepID=UPI001890FCC3|nr:30S ribosomal protein S11 [Candidatus Clavichlamydia salmonicola]MBF5050766.1 30S ribosomal protein S11 [Candidatus Clavichlamydia salmonicola]